MASRRRFSYQWRLFIPMVVTLWVIILSIGLWQYNNEKNARKQIISEQLALINARILAGQRTDDDMTRFIQFVSDYYRNNPNYDKLRVSVYENNRLISSVGEPVGLSEEEQEQEEGLTRTPGVYEEYPDEDTSDRYYFYLSSKSPDGRIQVFTVLPFDTDIMRATAPSSKMLLVIVLIGLFGTGLAFYFTRYLGRNITLLRNVAERAASDPNFIPMQDFPHDELGDISRQIIVIYNQRSKAMEREKKEHEVALHSIQERARSKRQLTNNINHELRTPIGVIKGYLDTILDNPDMDEAARTHFLKKAQEHINRLANLITDVAAITRLEEGGEMITTEELDYHDLVYTIANDVEDSGAVGELVFDFDVPMDCMIIGNYNLLAGMLLNLIKNSAAYSKGTMCELRCTGQDEKFFYFEFRDDGRGVSEEHLPHLFERFYRIDSGRARKAGGTGLGLPIVQNTILAHGGTITVQNGDLGGLSFKYSLPKAPVNNNQR